jgi:hypothetical protein
VEHKGHYVSLKGRKENISMATDSDENDSIPLKTIITWILTVGTVAAGIWQFAVQHAQSNRVPFLTKQLEVSFEASDTAARLATETDQLRWEKARQNFWRLYWGPLGIVEDPKVEQAMKELGKIVPKQPTTPELPMRSLERPSLRLAHATRDLILMSWNVDLPPLQAESRQ